VGGAVKVEEICTLCNTQNGSRCFGLNTLLNLILEVAADKSNLSAGPEAAELLHYQGGMASRICATRPDKKSDSWANLHPSQENIYFHDLGSK